VIHPASREARKRDCGGNIRRGDIDDHVESAEVVDGPFDCRFDRRCARDVDRQREVG
jgi:hypothetical protein